MNRFTLLLALLVSLAHPAAAQDWTAIPSGTSGTLRAIENTSFSPRYIVGDNGFVAQSNLDQTAWTPVSVGTSADLYSVIQPAFSQAWVGGVGGAVRVRDNTGTWSVRNIPSTETFSLFTRSSGQALAAGSGGSIWRSLNLGLDWTQQYAGTTPLRAGVGGTFGDGYVVGDGGRLLKGTSSGTVWTPLASGTIKDLHAVRFTAGSSIGAVGANGTIIRSLDNGATWLQMESGTSRTLRDLSTSKQNSNWMIAVGDDGVVLRSTDNGATWCRLTTGVTDDLYAAEMPSNSRYVVAGENGTLLRTETSGGSCVPGIDATLNRIGNGSIPAGGGPTQYTVALSNPSPESQTFQAWIDAVVPGGATFGPIQGPITLTFSPGQAIGPITFTQQVPGAAPAGNYTLRLRVGNFATKSLLDESLAFYSKASSLREAGSSSAMLPSDWTTLEGSFFEVVAEATQTAMRLAKTSGLEATYPNPVRSQTTLRFALTEAGPIRLTVYDVLGREVARLADGWQEAGSHMARFDARDLSSGVYIAQLRAGSQVHTQRMTVQR